MLTICEKCGKEVFIGEWPFCPHGFGNNLQKPMEPYTDTMVAGDPVEFRTIGEKVRYMDRNALVPRGERIQRDRSVREPSRADIHHAIRESIQELRR